MKMCDHIFNIYDNDENQYYIRCLMCRLQFAVNKYDLEAFVEQHGIMT